MTDNQWRSTLECASDGVCIRMKRGHWSVPLNGVGEGRRFMLEKKFVCTKDKRRKGLDRAFDEYFKKKYFMFFIKKNYFNFY